MSLEPGEACVEFHARCFTAFGNIGQPHSVSDRRYAGVMNDERHTNPATILRDNVEALLRKHNHVNQAGDVVWHKMKTDYKIGVGTYQRVQQAKTSIGINVVAKIAHAFHLEPWQLMVPNLDPSNPPVFALTESERNLYRKLREAALNLAEIGD